MAKILSIVPKANFKSEMLGAYQTGDCLESDVGEKDDSDNLHSTE